MRLATLLAALTLSPIPSALQAQWQIQDAHTTADLRGIDSLGNGVAWASGSDGTILRTEDSGFVWQLCAIPPNAEKLDFRAIQAFDNNTAVVMSSGKGDLSRLYKTTDGCQTWKLVFTNPDKEGFWDALVIHSGNALLVGDPVKKRFQIYASTDGSLEKWTRFGERSSMYEFEFDLSPYDGESLFAASNSVLKGDPTRGLAFVSGGTLGAKFSYAIWTKQDHGGLPAYESFKASIPLAIGPTAGAFSFAALPDSSRKGKIYPVVAVGGNYTQPDSSTGTAAWSKNSGQHWQAAKTQPHGYRSAVAYDPKSKSWITVGPNGTDISADDGRNWRPLKPNPAAGDPPDADAHWNALSLPFVVGPHGRIGTLRPDALPATKK